MCILKTRGEKINDNDNHSIKIYINKIENRITFKFKTGYYLGLLMPAEIMKLLGSTKSKITEGENVENLLHLEIAEVILVHCDIVSRDYQ